MNYSKEDFLSLYEQWKTLNNKINEALGNKIPATKLKKERDVLEKLRLALYSYAPKVVKQNPDDKEIACIVYSAFNLRAPRIYEKLSENLKNDKLVTMLAIKKFDESAYTRVGKELRGDPEVMYLLIKHVSGVDGISQCSPELLSDSVFWKEIFESRNNCLASEVGSDFSQVIPKIYELIGKYELNIDMGIVTQQYWLAKDKESRDSSFDVMGLYNSDWTTNPQIVQKVLNGDMETINKYLPESNLKAELLGNRKQSAGMSK